MKSSICLPANDVVYTLERCALFQTRILDKSAIYRQVEQKM